MHIKVWTEALSLLSAITDNIDESIVTHLDAYIDEFQTDNSQEEYLFYTIHDGHHTKMNPDTAHYMKKKHGKASYNTDILFLECLHCYVLRHV